MCSISSVLVLSMFLSMALHLADLLLVHPALPLLLHACAPALRLPFTATLPISSFFDICLQSQPQPHWLAPASRLFADESHVLPCSTCPCMAGSLILSAFAWVHLFCPPLFNLAAHSYLVLLKQRLSATSSGIQWSHSCNRKEKLSGNLFAKM